MAPRIAFLSKASLSSPIFTANGELRPDSHSVVPTLNWQRRTPEGAVHEPELSVLRYRAVPQSVQRASAHTHTAHVHFSLVCRIIPYRATASAADPMSEPQESSSPIPPTPRSVPDLRKTWCSLATTAIVALGYSVTRRLRNTQCPRSARTVPATVPAWEIKQCPRLFDL